MGIFDGLMRAMIRDGSRRPFRGRAYTLGRQTMGLTPENTLRAFREIDVVPMLDDIADIGIDNVTDMAKRSPDKKNICDVDFFRMLGLSEVLAIDVSDFEGAEVILDFNQPLPVEFEGVADLVVDGSLLDNIFNPCMGLQNVGRMLSPGGRCFLINRGNATMEHGTPYTIFNPFWFFDYFTWNDFAYCDVYVVSFAKQSGWYFVHSISHEYAARMKGNGIIKPVVSTEHAIAIAVYAEKGAHSTWDKIPTQHVYRNESDWERYSSIVKSYAAQERKPLMYGSGADIEPSIAKGIPAGYARMILKAR